MPAPHGHTSSPVFPERAGSRGFSLVGNDWLSSGHRRCVGSLAVARPGAGPGVGPSHELPEDHLRQLGLALLKFESARGVLPKGADAGPRRFPVIPSYAISLVDDCRDWSLLEK